MLFNAECSEFVNDLDYRSDAYSASYHQANTPKNASFIHFSLSFRDKNYPLRTVVHAYNVDFLKI